MLPPGYRLSARSKPRSGWVFSWESGLIDSIRCIHLLVKTKMDTFVYTKVQVIISAPGIKKA